MAKLMATYEAPGPLQEWIAPPLPSIAMCRACGGSGRLAADSKCPLCVGRDGGNTGVLVAKGLFAQIERRVELLNACLALDEQSLGQIAPDLCRVLTHPHDRNVQPYSTFVGVPRGDVVPTTPPFLAGLLLRRAGALARPALLQALAEADDPIACYRLLRVLSDASIPVPATSVLGLLQSPFFDLRLLAMDALPRVSGERKDAVPLLVASLHDDLREVQQMACWRQFGTPTPTVAYASDAVRVNWAAGGIAIVLSGLPAFRAGQGDAEAQATVWEYAPLAVEPEWRVLAEHAIMALAVIAGDNPQAWASHVAPFLLESDQSVRHAACRALSIAYAGKVELPAEVAQHVVDGVVLALRSGDAAVVRALRTWTTGSSEVVAAAEAALVLGSARGDAQSPDAALELLAVSSARLQPATIEKVIAFSAPEVVADQRSCALQALAAVIQVQGAPADRGLCAALLRAAAEPPGDEVVAESFVKLAGLVGDFVPDLIHGAGAAASLRLEARRSLMRDGELDDRRGWRPSIEALTASFPRLDTLMTKALNAAAPLAPGIVPRCTADLADQNPVVRLWSARALQALGRAAEPAIPALLRALDDNAWFPCWYDGDRSGFAAIHETERAAAMARLHVGFDQEVGFGYFAVREAAADALVAIGGAALAALDAEQLPFEQRDQVMTVYVVHEGTTVRRSREFREWRANAATRLTAALRASGGTKSVRDLERGAGRACAQGDVADISINVMSGDRPATYAGLLARYHVQPGDGQLPANIDALLIGMRAGGRRTLDISRRQLRDECDHARAGSGAPPSPIDERLDALRRRGGVPQTENEDELLTVIVHMTSLDTMVRDLTAAVGPGRDLIGTVTAANTPLDGKRFQFTIRSIDAARRTFRGHIAWDDSGRGSRDVDGQILRDADGRVRIQFIETKKTRRSAYSLRSHALTLVGDDGHRVFEGVMSDNELPNVTAVIRIPIDH